jgi:hypothetical protein
MHFRANEGEMENTKKTSVFSVGYPSVAVF